MAGFPGIECLFPAKAVITTASGEILISYVYVQQMQWLKMVIRNNTDEPVCVWYNFHGSWFINSAVLTTDANAGGNATHPIPIAPPAFAGDSPSLEQNILRPLAMSPPPVPYPPHEYGHDAADHEMHYHEQYNAHYDSQNGQTHSHCTSDAFLTQQQYEGQAAGKGMNNMLDEDQQEELERLQQRTEMQQQHQQHQHQHQQQQHQQQQHQQQPPEQKQQLEQQQQLEEQEQQEQQQQPEQPSEQQQPPEQKQQLEEQEQPEQPSEQQQPPQQPEQPPEQKQPQEEKDGQEWWPKKMSGKNWWEEEDEEEGELVEVSPVFPPVPADAQLTELGDQILTGQCNFWRHDWGWMEASNGYRYFVHRNHVPEKKRPQLGATFRFRVATNTLSKRANQVMCIQLQAVEDE